MLLLSLQEPETSLTTLALTEDAPIDPNEPVYCICQRVAFGGMVGCDNDDCELEWFHFPCVGLTEKVRGVLVVGDLHALVRRLPVAPELRRRCDGVVRVACTLQPTDMWYCPSCTAKMAAKAPRHKKRRRRRA